MQKMRISGIKIYIVKLIVIQKTPIQSNQKNLT
jgi:hypothetical protein